MRDENKNKIMTMIITTTQATHRIHIRAPEVDDDVDEEADVHKVVSNLLAHVRLIVQHEAQLYGKVERSVQHEHHAERVPPHL